MRIMFSLSAHDLIHSVIYREYPTPEDTTRDSYRNSVVIESLLEHHQHICCCCCYTKLKSITLAFKRADKVIVMLGFLPTFTVQGQICHQIRSLLPEANEQHTFLQVYFIGDEQNEVSRRGQYIEGVERDTKKTRKIAVAVAFSDIDATLLSDGRTAHFVLNLPLNLTQKEFPICNFSKNSSLGRMLRERKLLVTAPLVANSSCEVRSRLYARVVRRHCAGSGKGATDPRRPHSCVQCGATELCTGDGHRPITGAHTQMTHSPTTVQTTQTTTDRAPQFRVEA
ncbi:hypothetical protein EVAR_58135_1 [Eumeta japonica]|uniref:ATP-dependent DNA helicase n=1 Tax=Eumeta variegata TaxID=151549 RepID=A0A4C1YVN4_EUMVA|nr:hypothetical protein EVAR_58135_1 [Eumeta japonica]